MKRLSVIIIDNDPLASDRMREWCELHPELSLITPCTRPHEARRLILDVRPDLAILDVPREPLTALQWATALTADQSPLFLFVSTHDRYAARAFELNAVDYLLKPLHALRFSKAVRRAITRFQARQGTCSHCNASRSLEAPAPEAPPRPALREIPDHIVVEIGSRVHFIETAHLESLEAHKDDLLLCSKTETFTVCGSFADIEPYLPSGRFIRVSRSVMVNVRQITRMERLPTGVYRIELSSGRTVTSARTHGSGIEGLIFRKRSET